MKRVILFNGPPHCGKDTAGNACLDNIVSTEKIKFSDPVKVGTHLSYGIDAPADFYEDIKDTPLREFFGFTPREAYIAHSESYMKPLHGQEVFGNIFVNRAIRSPNSILVVPDSGFVEEAMPVIHLVGTDNVLLIRIHREGCDFSSDSRSYLDLPDGVTTLDIRNVEGEIKKYQEAILTNVYSWLC